MASRNAVLILYSCSLWTPNSHDQSEVEVVKYSSATGQKEFFLFCFLSVFECMSNHLNDFILYYCLLRSLVFHWIAFVDLLCHFRTMQSLLLHMVNWTVHCGHAEFVSNIELLNKIFHKFVQLWSKQEKAKRKRETDEQSFYRYHTQTCGDGLNEDERDEKDIATRFPSFEQVSYISFCISAVKKLLTHSLTHCIYARVE